MIDTERLKKILSVFEGKKGALIGILQRVQEEFGYLPEEVLAEIAKYVKVPESEVFSVATFYAHFYLNRRGDHLVKVCLGTACHVRGARTIMDAAQHRLGIKAGETTKDYKYSLERVACLGSCALAPIMVVDDTVHIQVSPKTITEMFAGINGKGKEVKTDEN